MFASNLTTRPVDCVPESKVLKSISENAVRPPRYLGTVTRVPGVVCKTSLPSSQKSGMSLRDAFEAARPGFKKNTQWADLLDTEHNNVLFFKL